MILRQFFRVIKKNAFSCLMGQILVLCFVLPSFATTYYVCDSISACNSNGGSGWAGTPSDSNDATSKATAAKSIKGAIAKMSGGDTVVVGNGTYIGLSNNLCGSDGYEYNSVPSGSSTAYTTIQAENDFGVTIDGGGTYTQIYHSGKSYIKYQGFILKSGGSNVYLSNCNHMKMIKLIAHDTSSGNVCNFNSATGSYILFEDCAAFGTGRYKFLIGGGSTYTILRRCVGRYDYHDAEQPHGVFSFYGAANNTNYCQNCIAIDSLTASSVTTRAFYAPNGSNNITFDSSIALNIDGYGNFFESGAVNPSLVNSVIWATSNAGSQSYSPPKNQTVQNCTFGVNSYGLISQNAIVVNSVFHGITSDAVSYATNSYCNLYGNGRNYANTSAGTGNKTLNSLTNGLVYLPRIEASSALKTAGSGGGQIGAQILYKLGVDGTLYGETGWNTLTSDCLWPWPNENVIKAQMASYSANGVNGARGFCEGTSLDGSSQTLTKYIWEYLGNKIPYEIYERPNAPTLLRIVAQ